MNKEEREELVSHVEERIDNELSYLNYDINDYRITEYDDSHTHVVDVEPDLEDSEDWPENWDEELEDLIADIVSDWGGSYSWNDGCISISIDADEDDDEEDEEY